MTQIQPDSLPGRGVPWWVILLAVLGGLLLLCLLAYGLYKVSGVLRTVQTVIQHNMDSTLDMENVYEKNT